MTIAQAPTCTGTFSHETRHRSVRACMRPADHDGGCGLLQFERIRFRPPRRVADYLGIVGYEMGDQMLSPAALEAHGKSLSSGKPCSMVVLGEDRREDGVTFLNYGVPVEYIEAMTNFRADPVTGELRWTCPDCLLKGGKHTKTCNRA